MALILLLACFCIQPIQAVIQPQTAAVPAPRVGKEGLNVVMVSPASDEPYRRSVIQVGIMAVGNDPAAALEEIREQLFLGIKDLTTGRMCAVYPGDRSLVVVKPERFAAMALGAVPLPGPDEINPPAIPVEAGHRYQIILQCGEDIVHQWTITVASATK
ncbi:hypothetical protein HY523_01595 [Candidatus Berkelbacteria bacterium]|nr:hypothetical protein [Candidatus Berkelbacteria bacterium]